MLDRLISFALHQRLLVVLALVVFAGIGIYDFEQLPIEAFPDVSDTQATLVTLDPGQAAEEVEKRVTIPLEIALTGLPHAVNMFSHTQFGLSYLTVTFDDAAKDLVVRQQVTERLTSVDLPPGIQPQLQPLATAIGEIYRFRLAGNRDVRELRTLEDWVVEKHLRQVPGVADVVTMGGRVKQFEINPDLGRLRDDKLTVAQLFAAVQRANSNSGGGAVAQGAQQFLVRSIGLLHSSADIEQIVVGENHGVPVRVKDVAEVRIGSAPQQGIVGQDASDDIVNGIVLMRKGENPSRVLEGVSAKVDWLNHEGLPRGVTIIPYYDRTWLIHRTLHTVFGNLLQGALLVTAVLYLFLSNVRAALIVALVIPLALLSTFMGLSIVGIPANLLSLGAMDFGIVVDGAVIVVENIFRRLGELKPTKLQGSRLSAVLGAATEVGRPTLFSMMIIIAAHLPIFTLQRHEGRIFAPMAYTVTSALLGSLLASLTLVPLLCYLWLGRNLPHEENRLVAWCVRHYRRALAWSLDHPRRVLVIAIGSLLLSLGVASRLGSEFLPELNEGSIWVNVFLPASVSIEEARQEVRRVREALHSVPEVDTVISKAGRPDDGTDPKNINSVELYVGLKPEKAWRAGYDKEALIREMDRAVSALPGLDPSFSQPIRDNVLESISQVDGQIVIKLYGDDLKVMHDKAQEILGVVHGVQGVAQAEIDREGELPQFLLEVDRPAAARYGLNVGDVQDLVETAVGGKPATQLYEGERHFDVVVRLPEPQRALDKLRQIPIATPDGSQVPLSEVVRFRTTSGAMDIARDNGRRVDSIGIFIRDRDMGSVVADLQAQVAQHVTLPPGYNLSWSGEFESQRRAMKRLAVVVPLSVLLIFMLLFNAFGSWRHAALIVVNIPLALIGGIVALFAVGMPLSVSAAIGFIALFGQAVLNGVVLVSHFNQLCGTGMPVREVVTQGATTRLRTLLMTALLAMLGLLPMALSHDIGSETQRPLAIVIIGGLISATALTLFVLPTLYVFTQGRAHVHAGHRHD